MSTALVHKILKAAQTLKDQINGDSGKARDVLRAEGVLDAAGNLTDRYRKDEQPMAEYLNKVTRPIAEVPGGARPSIRGAASQVLSGRPLRDRSHSPR